MEDFTGFLIYRIGTDVARVIERTLAPTGISGRELRVLSFLSAGELSQRELGTKAGLDRTTMVAVVDHLEELGHVDRRRSTEDRRKYVIVVTSKGRTTYNDAVKRLAKAEGDYLRSLDASQRNALHDTLRTLHAAHQIDC